MNDKTLTLAKPAAPKHPEIEHLCCFTSATDNMHNQMQRFGAEGWQLCAVIPTAQAGQQNAGNYQLIFARRK